MSNDRTVLVIDDSPTILLCVETILKAKGYNVITTKNSLEALYILNDMSIDVIISDIIMPDFSGLELYNLLQSNHKYSKIPFIMMTGSLSEQKEKEILNMGVRTIIYKSELISNLVYEIENYKNEILINY